MSGATIRRVFVFMALSGVVVSSFYLWFTHSEALLFGSTAEICIALGRLFGIAAQLLLLLQVLLVARVPLLEHAFGFDKMNVVHRFVGFGVLIFLFTHPLFLVYGYAAQSHISLSAQLTQFIQYWEDVVGGLFALFLYIIIGLTSWHIVRYRMKYEYWYGVHFLTYLALFAGFGHQTKFGTFSGTGAAAFFWLALMFGTVGLFLLFRWLDPMYLSWRHKLRVEKVVRENENTVSVYVTGTNMQKLTYLAGQYTSWRFHQGSLWSQVKTGFLFPHPFSFSQDYNGANLRLTAKALGDLTRQFPTIPLGTRVTIGRPRGRFVLPTKPSGQSDTKIKMLFLAGGVGITPLRCLAEAAHARSLDSVLLYSARMVNDFALLDECKKYATKIVCYTGDPTLDPKNTLYAGPRDGFAFAMLDTAAILRDCPDVRERHVYVCGPGLMMDAMIAGLKSLGVPVSQIHFEKFGY